MAWVLAAAAMVTDLHASAAGVVLLLFLLPVVTLSVVAVWLLFLLALGIMGGRRLVKGLGSRPRLRNRSLAFSIAGVLLLLAARFGFPPLADQMRGKQIEALAAQIPPSRESKSRVQFGACSMAFLGYSLTDKAGRKAAATQRAEAGHRSLSDAQAELASAKAAGAVYYRLGASGDHLLIDKPGQEQVDDQLVTMVKEAGLKLVLVDTQHPQVCRDRRLNWPEFCKFQERRIKYYQQRYQPEVYLVVCEPLSYHSFALKDAEYSSKDWAEQLGKACRLIKAANPATRTGICLLVGKDKVPEWEVWTAMRKLPELDLLTVEIYQPEDFGLTEARLKAFGHPRDFGKTFWIAETFNGWAMGPKRDSDQDAAWIRVAASFAQSTRAEAVLVWTFGTFVPGGSFWDFGNGNLAERWRQNPGLSTVGKAFREAASSQ